MGFRRKNYLDKFSLSPHMICVKNNYVFSVRHSLEPGWLEGSLDGKFGLIPENYVENIT